MNNNNMNTTGCPIKDSNINVPFESSFNRYASLMEIEDPCEFSAGEMYALGNLPLIAEAHYTLGKEKVKKLEYDVNLIKKELSRNTHLMIQRALWEGFGANTIFSVEQINSFLKEAFDSFNVKRTEPHYTDLMYYFYITYYLVKDSEGKTMKCIKIGEQKDLFSN